MKKQTKINLSEKEKQQLIEVAKKYQLNLLTLFGSRAKGTSKIDSDYDLAYLRKEKFTTKEQDKFENEILKIVAYKDFDLIEISQKTSIILKFEIFKNGIPLFTSNNKYYNYIKDNTYFDYVDSKSMLEPTKEKFLSSPL